MKTITPVSVWHAGSNVSADKLNLLCTYDNLEDTARFYYDLSLNGEVVTQGNLTMTGSAYTSYNSKTYAWNWAAAQLGLNII